MSTMDHMTLAGQEGEGGSGGVKVVMRTNEEVSAWRAYGVFQVFVSGESSTSERQSAQAPTQHKHVVSSLTESLLDSC